MGTGYHQGPCIIWEGSFFSSHSFSHVNREAVLALMARGVDVRPVIRDDPARLPQWHLAQRFEPLRRAANRAAHEILGRVPGSVLYVRHAWPPDFARPLLPAGSCFAVMQPWEYGYIPAAWVGSIKANVDEIWAYSTFVRDAYIRSGIPPQKVVVIPCGVNPRLFNPGAAPAALTTSKGFKFLFVGGAATNRKGFDILLAAYSGEFRASDDVCLVVKDNFYGPVTEQVAQVSRLPGSPEILYIYHDLHPDAMAGIYTACNCYVQPYRAEGFGLPILEAMACGLPVITVNYGPCLDYCVPGTTYFIDAKTVKFPANRVGEFITVGTPFWAEPDVAALRAVMRYVYQHREEARAKGLAASLEALTRHTWERTAESIMGRLLHKID
ncbi:MAG TPA: glycosyltransferase family 4 protein [Firmicutes bacterium]|nr:glycosyltransferase family 4 protein [Bacillota bacterium]